MWSFEFQEIKRAGAVFFRMKRKRSRALPGVNLRTLVEFLGPRDTAKLSCVVRLDAILARASFRASNPDAAQRALHQRARKTSKLNWSVGKTLQLADTSRPPSLACDLLFGQALSLFAKFLGVRELRALHDLNRAARRSIKEDMLLTACMLGPFTTRRQWCYHYMRDVAGGTVLPRALSDLWTIVMGGECDFGCGSRTCDYQNGLLSCRSCKQANSCRVALDLIKYAINEPPQIDFWSARPPGPRLLGPRLLLGDLFRMIPVEIRVDYNLHEHELEARHFPGTFLPRFSWALDIMRAKVASLIVPNLTWRARFEELRNGCALADESHKEMLVARAEARRQSPRNRWREALLSVIGADDGIVSYLAPWLIRSKETPDHFCARLQPIIELVRRRMALMKTRGIFCGESYMELILRKAWQILKSEEHLSLSPRLIHFVLGGDFKAAALSLLLREKHTLSWAADCMTYAINLPHSVVSWELWVKMLSMWTEFVQLKLPSPSRWLSSVVEAPVPPEPPETGLQNRFCIRNPWGMTDTYVAFEKESEPRQQPPVPDEDMRPRTWSELEDYASHVMRVHVQREFKASFAADI
jgi:hypothetical protein